MSIGPRLIIISEAAINGMKSTHMRSTPGIIEVETKRKKGTRKERNLKGREKGKNEARVRGLLCDAHLIYDCDGLDG